MGTPILSCSGREACTFLEAAQERDGRRTDRTMTFWKYFYLKKTSKVTPTFNKKQVVRKSENSTSRKRELWNQGFDGSKKKLTFNDFGIERKRRGYLRLLSPSCKEPALSLSLHQHGHFRRPHGQFQHHPNQSAMPSIWQHDVLVLVWRFLGAEYITSDLQLALQNHA